MTPGGARSRPLRAMRMSLGVVAKICSDRVVELADAREPRGKRDVGEGQLGCLDEHARALGSLRTRERDRPRTDLRLSAVD